MPQKQLYPTAHFDFANADASSEIITWSSKVSFTFPPNAKQSAGDAGPWIGILTPGTEKLLTKNSWYRAQTGRRDGFLWAPKHTPPPGQYEMVMVPRGGKVKNHLGPTITFTIPPGFKPLDSLPIECLSDIKLSGNGMYNTADPGARMSAKVNSNVIQLGKKIEFMDNTLSQKIDALDTTGIAAKLEKEASETKIALNAAQDALTTGNALLELKSNVEPVLEEIRKLGKKVDKLTLQIQSVEHTVAEQQCCCMQ